MPLQGTGKIMTKWSVFLATALTLAAGSPAPAATAVYWSAISTSCVPDSLSIQANRYRSFADSNTQHQTGNVDRITLVCGVAPNPGSPLPNTLSLTYLDSTGNSSNAQSTAELMRVNRTTAAVSTVAAVNSDTFLTKSVSMGKSPTFSHQLNFENSYYFVRIVLDRATTAQDVRAIGVALESQN